jgi:hypothetical protein
MKTIQNDITLPSGVRVNLDTPDFLALKTPDDFLELQCALQEKIIDIELQIDLFKVGHFMSDKMQDVTWLPRANAALKWAKLYRDECAKRGGRFNDRIKEARQREREGRFVAEAKKTLTEDQFRAIARASGLYEDNRVEEAA